MFLTPSFPPTGYRLYKRKCGAVPADSDSEAPSVDDAGVERAKEKRYPVENGAFEFDGNGNSKEKSKDIDKNTKL